MKKYLLFPGIMLAMILFLGGCSPVTLTSWTNPKSAEKSVNNLLVWAMFDRTEYRQPFEQTFYEYLSSQGIKAMTGTSYLSPQAKYDYKQLEKKFDSLGVDGILIFTYRNTDKIDNYVPAQTVVYPDYYFNYYNYYSWGYPYYGPGYNAVTTGGYWTTTTVVNLTANLYGNSKDDLIWSATIAVEDPKYIDQAAYNIAQKVVADLKRNGIVK